MFRMTRAALLALLIGLGAMTACNGDENAANDSQDTDPQAAGDTQVQAQPETSTTPTPAPDQGPQELAGAHILIMYQGSERAPATITRTKEEALALAQEVARKAKDGGDFTALAKEYSDGPSGPQGGDLGVWVQGRMVPEFDTAILGMEIGGVSDPVETAFGYHVITRKKVDKVSARHILVMHNDSMRKPAEISRTKEEAMARVEEVKQKLDAGQGFEDLAREYSDGPSSTKGGDLGSFGRGQMHAAFETAAFDLEVGGVSDAVETPFGYHLIQRYR
ncbi:MAG: peptidylprolyl isomerase [Candidatus Krumholzibacteria bacterium]|nr:peptidylprolyl isomerase [Candidatus Krumholzibacteria bacterium]